MSLQHEHPELPEQQFAALFAFLRDAFRKSGLVSIPPEVLHRFKKYPLDGIDCPDIPSFAGLFEGPRSNNTYRLEAHSFVYTVQIMFHVKPNDAQDRILHMLMASVRLLKDEGDAAHRLSHLAGRGIDRYTVARKRTTISNKLIPWLLKHFAKDSTSFRLKIIAAQFLFHLLQGDREAKTILSLAPKKDRWSLGSTVHSCPDLPVRIFAADVLREMSLASIDWLTFWPPDLAKIHHDPIPSSFMADAKWLAEITRYLCEIDDRQATPANSRANAHHILSLSTLSTSFPGLRSSIIAIVSDRISFVLPADQSKALQILEIPLMANMRYQRTDGIHGGDDQTRKSIKLQIQLQRGGFLVCNGLKDAVDEVHLCFLSTRDCCDFERAIDHSLRKATCAPLRLVLGEVDVGETDESCRPTKQSRSTLIDFSQDLESPDDTQLSPPHGEISHPLLAGARLDVSPAEQLSKPLVSGLQDRKEKIESALKSKKSKEEQSSERCNHTRQGLSRSANANGNNDPTPGNDNNTDRLEDPHRTGRKSEGSNFTARTVAPAKLQSQRRSYKDSAPLARKGLPLPLYPPRSQARRSARVSSNLQHLASEALQQSVEEMPSAVHKENRRLPHLSGHCLHPDGPQSERLEQRPQSALSISANSGKRLSLKPKPRSHLVRTTRQGAIEKMDKAARGLPRGGDVGDPGGATVDWDEDLREENDQSENKFEETSQANQSRGRKIRSHLSTAGKWSKKPTAPKKKAKTKKAPADAADTVAAADHSHQTLNGVLKPSVQLDAPRASIEIHHQATQPDRSTAVPSTAHHNQAVDEGVRHMSSDKGAAMATTRSNAGHSRSPAASITSITMGETSDSPRTANARSGSNPSPGEAENPTHGLSLGTLRFADDHRHRSENSTAAVQGFSGREVEVVHDSLPMDSNQCANAITKARRSFGSTLADIMTANGMQTIEEPESIEVRRSLLGDDVSIVESSSTFAPNLLPLTVNDQPSPSPVRIQEDSPPSLRGKNDELLHSARPPEKCQLDAITPISPLGVEVRDESPSTKKDAYLTAILDFPLGTQKPSGTPCKQSANDWVISERSWQAKFTQSDGSGTKGIVERSGATANPAAFAPGSPQASNLAPLPDNEQKRTISEMMEKTRQVKRARRTTADHDPALPPDEPVENIVLPCPEVSEWVQVGTSDGTTASRSSARGLLEVTNIEKGTAASATKQKHGHGQTYEPPRNHSIITSGTDRLASDLCKNTTATLMDCDHMNQKSEATGSNGSDRQEQKLLTNGREVTCRTGLVPGETSKHLAFKRRQGREKVVRTSEKASTRDSRLLFGSKNRRVQFKFSDTPSTMDELRFGKENTVGAPKMSLPGRSLKKPLLFSKVDENGSPRLHLQGEGSMPLDESGGLVSESSPFSDESADTSVPKSSDSEWLETHQSNILRLDRAVSSYKDTTRDITLDWKSASSRPSIGIGKLLDRKFPHASQKIQTESFKAGSTKAVNSLSDRSKISAYSAEKVHALTQERKTGTCRGGPINKPVYTEDDPTASFDIGQLSVSIAEEQSSSVRSGRARRLRSSSAPLPLVEEAESNASPASFKTRLGRMSTLPGPTKEQHQEKLTYSSEVEPRKRQEASTMIDAETTLVSGEAYEDGTSISHPQRHNQVKFSSPKSSEDAPAVPANSLKQYDSHGLCTERRFWNQKIAETHQTVTDILEQVSRKLLWRFARAEEGIGLQLNYYCYGGRKILNNLVEQFDQRVTQEKKTPSVRVVQYRRRLEDAIEQLQQAKGKTRMGPSLDDLQKSHDKRCDYVMANLERFSAAQSLAE